MYLKRLIVKDFKNIADADLTFSDGLNCVCGDNGEGKTNLLDAVWHLSMTKSLLLPTDRFTPRQGTGQAILNGTYISDGGEQHQIAFSLSVKGDKVLKRDGKTYTRLSDHIGTVPVVAISPADTSIISDSGEERRRFLNIMLSQTDRSYLHALQSYNRCLQQRNRVLHQMAENTKNGSGNGGLDLLLETLSAQMAAPAAEIHKARKDACGRISEMASALYGVISGEKETVVMTYVSDLDRTGMSELLTVSEQKDRILQYTSTGVHRDDIRFEMDGRPMKQCASQGQQKSFLVAVKMAQYSLMRERYGTPPILLLDDIFDKLDSGRVKSLLKMVSSSGFGQIFITDTEWERLAGITPEASFFSVKGGVIE